MLILSSICPIFFHSKLRIMKFFVKDSCETVQARVVIFGMQVDNDVLYHGIVNQPSLSFSSVIFQFSFFPYFDNEGFRQRLL